MKYLTILILFCSKLYAQDTLRLQLNRYDERPLQMTQFIQKDSGVIILTCSSFDQEMLNLINKHRDKYSLQLLKSNVRLDTLAEKEAFLMAKTKRYVHYTHFKEMNKYRDLMNVENIAADFGLSTNKTMLFIRTTPQLIVDAWINSPGHNANLLFKETETLVTSTKSIVVVKFRKSSISWSAYFVYETDMLKSVRERQWVSPLKKHANY